MLQALDAKTRKTLNGDGGAPSPMGFIARDVLLGDRLDEVASMISGTATVANGDTTVTVDVGAAYDGKPVLLTFGEAPTAATIVSGSVAAGTLTITIDQDNTADLDVHYMVDGR